MLLVETAQKLSTQLRAAEARIAEFEAKNQFIERGQEKRKYGSAEFIPKSRRALFESDDFGQPTVMEISSW
jgi:hypothetical protein